MVNPIVANWFLIGLIFLSDCNGQLQRFQPNRFQPLPLPQQLPQQQPQPQQQIFPTNQQQQLLQPQPVAAPQPPIFQQPPNETTPGFSDPSLLTKPMLFQFSGNPTNLPNHLSRFHTWYLAAQVLPLVEDRGRPEYILSMQPNLLKGIPTENLTQVLLTGSSIPNNEVLKLLIEQSPMMLKSQQAVISLRVKNRLNEPFIISTILSSDNPSELFEFFNSRLLLKNMPNIIKTTSSTRSLIKVKLLPKTVLSTWLSFVQKLGRVQQWTMDDLNGKSLLGASNNLGLALLGFTCKDVEMIKPSDTIAVIDKYRKEVLDLKRNFKDVSFPSYLKNCALKKVLEYLRLKNETNGDTNILNGLTSGEVGAIGGEILTSIPAEALANLNTELRQDILQEIAHLDSSELILSPLNQIQWYANTLFKDLSNSTQSPEPILKLGNLFCYTSDLFENQALKQALMQRNVQTDVCCLSNNLRDKWSTLIKETFGDPSKWSPTDLNSIGDLLIALSEEDMDRINVEAFSKSGLQQRPSKYTEVVRTDKVTFVKACVQALDHEGVAYYEAYKRLMRLYLEASQHIVNTVKSVDEILLNRMSLPLPRSRRDVFQGRRVARQSPLQMQIPQPMVMMQRSRPPTQRISKSKIIAAPSSGQVISTPAIPPLVSQKMMTTPNKQDSVRTQSRFPTISQPMQSQPMQLQPTIQQISKSSSQSQQPSFQIAPSSNSPNLKTPSTNFVASPNPPLGSAASPTLNIQNRMIPAPMQTPPIGQQQPSGQQQQRMTQQPSGGNAPMNPTNPTNLPTPQNMTSQERSINMTEPISENPIDIGTRASNDSTPVNATDLETRDLPEEQPLTNKVNFTCRGIKSAGPAAIALKLQDISNLPSDELFDCVEPLGLIDWDEETKFKILKIYNEKLHLTTSSINTILLIELGTLVSAFSSNIDNIGWPTEKKSDMTNEMDISQINLTLPSSLDILSILGSEIKEPVVLKTLADKFTEQNQIFTGPNIRGPARQDHIRLTLWSLGNIICGLDQSILSNLFTSDATLFIDVSPMLGRLEGCSEDTLNVLANFAVRASNYGPVSGWSQEDLGNVGVVVAGLKPEDLESIPAESMAGLQPLAIKSMPPSSLQKMTPEQISNLNYESAISLSPQQQELLTPDQQIAIKNATVVQSDDFKIPPEFSVEFPQVINPVSDDIVEKSVNETEEVLISGRAIPSDEDIVVLDPSNKTSDSNVTINSSNSSSNVIVPAQEKDTASSSSVSLKCYSIVIFCFALLY